MTVSEVENRCFRALGKGQNIWEGPYLGLEDVLQASPVPVSWFGLTSAKISSVGFRCFSLRATKVFRARNKHVEVHLDIAHRCCSTS